jgi:hypothetical protein
MWSSSITPRDSVDSFTPRYRSKSASLAPASSTSYYYVDGYTRAPIPPPRPPPQPTPYKYEYQDYPDALSYQPPAARYDYKQLERTVMLLEQRIAVLEQRDSLSVIKQQPSIRENRIALLIGINYNGTSNKLNGCVLDVIGIAKMLAILGYTQFVFLVDEQIDQSQFTGSVKVDKPTKANILRYLSSMLRDSVQNSRMYLHYSGHGTSVPCYDGSEEDGNNEALCPVDMDRAGMLIDDELHEVIFKNIQANTKLRCVFDCCHSGTSLDLPFTRGVKDKVGIVMKPNSNLEDIIMISGCMDNQTSADTREGGAMTRSVLENINTINGRPIDDVVSVLRQWMKRNRFEQIPCISFNKSNPVFDL